MLLDAHYYAVLAFSRACGFKRDSASDVAYASQFVDDAKINHVVIHGDPGDIQCDDIDGKHSFFNMATCHSYTRMKTFNYSSMINNTCAFHFVPGCEGKNFPKKLRCAEESQIIVGILNDALKEDDLVKWGMVLHAYADTFSHQGFSGLLSKVNDIKACKTLSRLPWNWLDKISKVIKWFAKDKFDRLFDSAMPAYGHGQAMTYPDMPHLTWSYEYDYSDAFSTSYKSSGEIDNKERFKRAFEKIRTHMTSFLEQHPRHKDRNVSFDNLDILFDTLVTERAHKERQRNWKKIMVSQGFFEKDDPALTYDEDRWLKDAFEGFEEEKFHQRKVEGARLASKFPDSNWYKYYMAAKWYRERFFEYCSQYELDIPR